MFEKCNPAHPDKLADRIAGAITDLAYTKNENPRIATEVLLGHGQCSLQIETSERLTAEELEAIVHRIAGEQVEVRALIVPQDVHLADNQAGAVRCGDNGIFRGCAPTHEQKLLTAIATSIYDRYPTDGKYILTDDMLTVCQSNANKFYLGQHLETFIYDHGGNVETLEVPADVDQFGRVERFRIEQAALETFTLDGKLRTVHINPLGPWTGGTDVDCGATNRKLGSDMGDGVTGGGLHGKDLSKADVSVNIWCYLESIRTGREVTACCSIGDETVCGIPYRYIVEQARLYIHTLGGFERFAEWGLIRPQQ